MTAPPTLPRRSTSRSRGPTTPTPRPVVFIHGLWLLPSSWDRWARAVRGGGIHARPARLARRPGHGRGGAREPAGLRGQDRRADRRPPRRRRRPARPAPGDRRALLRRAVHADPRGPGAGDGLRGHRPGAVPRRPTAARLRAEVGDAGARATRATGGKAIALTWEQFRYGWANAPSEEEGRELHETFHVAAPGAPLFQAAPANLNPLTEVKVDTKNPARGPLLIISGEKDNTVPWALANAAYKRQKRNPGVTEITELPEPRPLAGDRQRLAGGRADRAGLRQALRLSCFPHDRVARVGHGRPELAQHAGERLAAHGAEGEDVREDAAVGERLRRLAQRVDERVVPRAGVAELAGEAGELARRAVVAAEEAAAARLRRGAAGDRRGPDLERVAPAARPSARRSAPRPRTRRARGPGGRRARAPRARAWPRPRAARGRRSRWWATRRSVRSRGRAGRAGHEQAGGRVEVDPVGRLELRRAGRCGANALGLTPWARANARLNAASEP